MKRFAAYSGWLVAVALVLSPVSAAAQSSPFPGRPQGAPIDAASAFDPALSCMDELLSRSSQPASFVLVPQGIADPTDKGGFTRDMIIDAATKMSRRSHFFRIMINRANVVGKTGFLQTAGSVTAFEQQVQSKDNGGGISIASAVGATVKSQRGISTLTVSLYLTDANEQLVDGTFHSRTMRLETKSKSGFLSSFIQIVGGSLSLTSTESDGVQSGVKALIDLTMIEAVGSFMQLPYATCLARVLPSDNVASQFRDFKRMKPEGQRAAVLTEMTRRGLAPANPSPEQLQQAIASFQRAQGLAPSGQIGFELYQALINLSAPPAPMNRPAAGKPAVKVSGAPGPFIYPNGQMPFVRAGDKLAFQATVAEPAYVACYYTDSVGKVIRVFPNQYRSAYRLAAGEILRMPSEQDPYVIRAQTGNTGEWFSCLAGNDDFLPRISDSVPDIAFTPLDRFHSARELVDAALAADQTLSTDTLTFRVQ
ncbi:DUF4384 domain-containing protein [Sphingomonas sp. GB1N7]|uniref:DUF4384 domain-containing protein n=1 Tax=Parasphingomonas caseinilytica TaxID=3096158 RepID=UPI002FC77DE4